MPSNRTAGIRSFITDNFLFRDDRAGLGDQESLLDAGLIDSIGVLELVAFLEGDFGMQVADTDIVPANLDTIRSIAAYVAGKHPAGRRGAPRERHAGRTLPRDSARRFPDKTALVAGGRRLTFAELDRMADRLAAGLVANGLERGDRVVIFMDNAWEAVAAILAVLKAGGVFCPVNSSTKADKLAYVLGNCRAAALVTQDKLATTAAAAARAATSVRFASSPAAKTTPIVPNARASRR